MKIEEEYLKKEHFRIQLAFGGGNVSLSAASYIHMHECFPFSRAMENEYSIYFVSCLSE